MKLEYSKMKQTRHTATLILFQDTLMQEYARRLLTFLTIQLESEVRKDLESRAVGFQRVANTNTRQDVRHAMTSWSVRRNQNRGLHAAERRPQAVAPPR